jgi:hypothetical protein
MMTVGIETRATIPSKNLEQFEKELFSLGFSGSLTKILKMKTLDARERKRGVGLLKNGIIVRSEIQENNPEVTLIEFSYPPCSEEKIFENVCNQHSAFFNLIKQYGGNPYPWYINLEKFEEGIEGCTYLKLVRDVVRSSLNPLHVTVDRIPVDIDLETASFSPFSLGTIHVPDEILSPPLALKCNSENFSKNIDLREFAKNYRFGNSIPSLEMPIEQKVYEKDKNKWLHEFRLTALPQNILPLITTLQISKNLVLGEINHKIRELNKFGRNFFSFFSKPLPTGDSVLREIESKIKKLDTKPFEHIPIKEIILNHDKFKDMAKEYLNEKWGIAYNPLVNAYALFLSQIDYVDKMIAQTEKKLHEVTNFYLVEYKEDKLTNLLKSYNSNIHHDFHFINSSDEGIVNFRFN